MKSKIMVLMLPYFAKSPSSVTSQVDFPPTPSKGPRCKRRAGPPEGPQPAPAYNSIRQQGKLAQERINLRRPQSVTDRPKRDSDSDGCMPKMILWDKRFLFLASRPPHILAPTHTLPDVPAEPSCRSPCCMRFDLFKVTTIQIPSSGPALTSLDSHRVI